MRTMSLKSVRRRRLFEGITALSVVALALTGCGGEPTDVKTTVEADVNAEKSPPPPPETPEAWPLTGVPGAVAMRPAVTVKIENSAAARPQTGLENADMVWEELVEGGITRFAAMYHSETPDSVGPIRSVRPMDAGIAGATGGILAFSGGIPAFVKSARDAGLQIVSQDEGAKGFSRSKARKAPHNVYGNLTTFIEQADESHQAPPPPMLEHAREAALASATASGSPATSLKLAFSTSVRPSWDYEAASGMWRRSENGKPFLSASGDRIETLNVVILRVDIRNSSAVDPAGSPVPETMIVGSGEAIIATGGKYVTGTWMKADLASPIAITGANGEVLKLAPGKSWVELVPNSTGPDGAAIS